MRRLLPFAFASLLAAPLSAQAPSGISGQVAGPSPFPPGYGLGVGVLAATGMGDFAADLNDHPGFGFQIQGYLPVASHLQVRPAFEWTGYRVSDYNLAARTVASSLGFAYQETRVVFRTYRLGFDALLYKQGGYTGPYLDLALGIQRSQAYLEDRAVDPNGNEQVTTLDTRAQKTGLWLGVGAGYHWSSGYAELRLSEAPYAFTTTRPLSAQPTEDLPFQARKGWALHLLLGVRL